MSRSRSTAAGVRIRYGAISNTVSPVRIPLPHPNRWRLIIRSSRAICYGYGGFVVKVVSSQSDEDVARGEALRDLRWALRELTANLMRISAQAGKPEMVGEQCVAVVKPMRKLLDLGSAPYDWAMQEMLNFRPDLGGMNLDRENTEWERGLALIVKGAVRMAAAELVDQGPQEAAGESMIFDGLAPIEAIRERNRKERERRERVGRSGARKVKR